MNYQEASLHNQTNYHINHISLQGMERKLIGIAQHSTMHAETFLHPTNREPILYPASISCRAADKKLGTVTRVLRLFLMTSPANTL